jgi:hypothetical protein
MRTRTIALIALTALLAAATAACYRPYGYRLYPDTPRFAPTNPAGVELLRREPRREHLRLGEVWIRPTPRMSRGYVESVLREKTAAMGGDALVIVADKFYREGVVFSYWYGPRPVYERQIVGIAVRYKR